MTTDAAAVRGSVVGEWIRLVRRRWRAGALVFAVVAAAAAALLFLTAPIYRAEARLRLAEPPPSSGLSLTSGFFGLLRPGGDPFSNDLEVLGSRSVAEAVVEDAALAVTVDAPGSWYRDSLFHRLAAAREAEEATYRLEWRDGAVHVRRTQPSDSAAGAVAPGDTLAIGGLVLVPRAWREGMPRSAELRVVPFGEAVRRVRSGLVAERARREANVLDLSYDHPDPGVAERVVSAVLDRFIAVRAALQERESGTTVDSLRRVAEETARELAEAEDALEALQRETRLVAVEAQSEAFVERYAEAAVELETTRAEQRALAGLLERLQGEADPIEVWMGLAAFPRFLENPTVGHLLARLTGLRGERLSIASVRTEESRALELVDRQIAELDAALRELARSYLAALGKQVQELEARVGAAEAVLAGLPERMSELGRRTRRVRLLTEVLLLTEQRLRQEELRQALTYANVQVIDPPALRWKPVWPRRKLGTIVGLGLAGLFGLLGMVVAERADGSVRRAGEARALAGAPVLAVARRNGRGSLDLAPAEARAVIGRSGAEDGRGVVLVPVGSGAAATELARVLEAWAADEAAERAGASPPPPVRAAPAMDGPAAASALDGARAVLVVEHGRTDRRELARAAGLLAEAGAAVAGVVVVCDGAREAAEVWS